jgi:hypothetical protein
MAQSTAGTQLLLSDAGDYTSVACVTDIGGPQSSLTMIDATCLESTHIERIAGVVESGEVPITINWDPDAATHDDMRAALESRASSTFAISWANFGATTSTVTFAIGTTATSGAAHSLITGQAIRFSTSDALPAELSTGTTYYANVSAPTTFTVHTTNAAAVAGTGAISFSGTGTGTHTVDKPTRWDFTAFVSNFQPSAPTNDKLTASVTLTITGSIVG